MRQVRRHALLIGCVLTLSACAGTVDRDAITDSNAVVCVPCDRDACGSPVTIRFLGTAGFKVTFEKQSILLSPFFSHHSLARVLFARLKTDKGLVDRLARRYRLDEAAAIFAGHGHYDHALDIPYIATTKTPRATVYVSESVANMLHGDKALRATGRVRAISADAWDPSGTSTALSWFRIPGTAIEFAPIRSRHAPHFLGFTLGSGRYAKPQSELPRGLFGWKAGEVLAFLFRFGSQDQDTRPVTLLYLDSATTRPDGFPPAAFGNVDILIPTVALYSEFDDHPESIIDAVAPEYVVLGHWHDLFQTYTADKDEIEPATKTNVTEFIERLHAVLPAGSRATLPAPGTTMIYGGAVPPPACAQQDEPAV